MSKTPYLMGDTMVMKKPFKPKDHTRNKAKGFTFLASVFSFFICTSIFYLLNYSPDNLTSLFNNNIFWFFLSNALILILAADYEAFTSHSNKTHQDQYEEYVKHSQASRNYNHCYVTPPSSYDVVPTSKYEQVDQTPRVSVLDDHVPSKQELLQEKKKEITVPDRQDNEFVPERVLEIVPQNNPKRSSSSSKKKPEQDDSSSSIIKYCEEKTFYAGGRAVGRSKSDRYGHVKKRVVVVEGKNRAIRRAKTMKVEEERVEEENNYNNEFSCMSNEELNRRVEEFIQRFNRQIRLQAVRNSVAHEA